MSSAKQELLGKTGGELVELAASMGVQAFRGRQIFQWIMERRAASFDEMSDLPGSFRARLSEFCTVGLPEVVSRTAGADMSEKFLFCLADGTRVEAVYIKAGDRTTVCVSSQAGCALDCKFCVTGRMGSGRNLTAGEIVGQYLSIARERQFERANVVFMGMGEPLLNVPNLNRALDLLFTQVSPKRVTVSTAGIVPGIAALAGREQRPNLAISLSAPDDETRSRLMPINRTYPISDLFTALRKWPLEKGRRITFEYVLISAVNDTPEMARRLARLLRPLPSKVNLIPLNESREWLPGMTRPSENVVDEFGRVLAKQGVDVTVRWSKGLGADAACGQLKGRETPRKVRTREGP